MNSEKNAGLSSKITLVMTLVIRDEADLIQAQIRYHRAQGVDHFLVLDHRSVDASPELLQPFVEAGCLSLFQEHSLARYQGQWVTALARRAACELGADWVINNDADEFWWSDRGSLKEVLATVPAQYRLAAARRHNFILPAETAADVDTETARPFWQSQIYRQVHSVNFLGQPLSGKICHRGEAEIVVHHGNHSVAPMQASDLWPEQAFEIFHFPIRSFAQFKRKVRNGGGSWVANASLPPEIGQGKRSLYQDYLTGRLRERYRQWCLDEVALQTALADGQICSDERLRNFLRQLPSV